MSTHLFSFLGRSPKRDGQYQRTRYRFPDGSDDEASFFGFSLQRRLRAERMVILGTAGSMWDHLFDQLSGSLGDQMETERLSLIDAVEHKTVEQAQLDHLAPLLGQALGCECQLQLIPYARSEAEQLAIVRQLAHDTVATERLHLDITHGFRHLPMLALAALQALRALNPALRIEAIWYGAYDPDLGDAPVHDLSGMLKLLDGAAAISRFDKDGDYTELANLMHGEGAEHLRQAAFFERTHQTGQARGRLDKARAHLVTEPDNGLESLFHSALNVRLEWSREVRLYQRQRELADFYLARRDFLRATLFGFEAFITRLMVEQAQPGQHTDNFEHRADAKQMFEDQTRAHDSPGRASYRLLRDLRNQLAHGVSSPRVEVQKALSAPDRLAAALQRVFDQLLADLP